jgi:predicted DNA-binding protein (MmcQ/YjbR family)
MNVEQIREYCLKKKEVTESFPFSEFNSGEGVLVFKVAGKMFLLIDLGNPDSINLKCDPERAIELREKYDDIIPGYHMHKKHWNTVMLNGSLDTKFILELIDHSYEMVIKSMGKKAQQLLSGK